MNVLLGDICHGNMEEEGGADNPCLYLCPFSPIPTYDTHLLPGHHLVDRTVVVVVVAGKNPEACRVQL